MKSFTSPKNQRIDDENCPPSQIIIWFRLPYVGDVSNQLFRSCVKKIKRNLKPGADVIFKPIFDTTKIELFCNTKDQTPLRNQSNVVYEFKCPDCGAKYIGKTERTLF